MDAALKKILKPVTLALRHLLEGEYDAEGRWHPGDLEQRLAAIGVRRDRAPVPVDELAHLPAEDRHARKIVDAYLKLREEAGVERSEAVAEFIRETAYTWANRLIALRCMEARELIDSVILQQDTYGGRSLEHHRLAQRQPELCAGEDDGLYAVLDKVFREQTKRLPMLFDPQAPGIALRPSAAAIKDCFGLLSLNADSLSKYRIRIKEDENAAVDAELPNPFVAPDALGWTYQYWNTEEKDRVFEKVRTVKGAKIAGADIVPATQLYTEDYMVKFLVQNSLGATWMGMYPESKLFDHWEYYVRDADRAPVEPKPLRKITFLDPACGSGHFLLEAFDLFYAMYDEERELTKPEDICTAILTNNLFGIDIDARAVQIAEVALWMKAAERAFDFAGSATNLVAATSSHLKGPAWEEFLAGFDKEPSVARVLRRFARTMEHIDEIGSLARPAEDLQAIIREEHVTWERQVREEKEANFLFAEMRTDALSGQLPFDEITDKEFGDRLFYRTKAGIDAYTEHARKSGDFDDQLLATETHSGFRLLHLLSQSYDVVAANPPYLGFRKMAGFAHKFLKLHYPRSCYDLYAVFIERSVELANSRGIVAIVTMHSYMFVPSLTQLRETLVNEHELMILAHLGAGAFDELGDHAPAVLTIARRHRVATSAARRLCVIPHNSDRDKARLLRDARSAFKMDQNQFAKIPGTPFAYSLPNELVNQFVTCSLLGGRVDYRNGMFTTNNPRFLRYFWECTSPRWRPYYKVPTSERWYGPSQYMVDWNNQGDRLKAYSLDKHSSYTFNIVNERYFFKPGLVLKATGSMGPCAKILEEGHICDIESTGVFCDASETAELLFLHNSRLAISLLHVLNPTPHFYITDLERLPYVTAPHTQHAKLSDLLSVIVAQKRILHSLQIDSPIFEPYHRLVKGSLRNAVTAIQIRRMQVGVNISLCEASADAILVECYHLGEEASRYIQKTAGVTVGSFPAYPDDVVRYRGILDNRVIGDQILLRLIEGLPLPSNEGVDHEDLAALLRPAYEAGSKCAWPDEETSDSTESEEQDALAEGDAAAVKVPHETFVQQAAEVVKRHPISVYAALEKGLQTQGWRATSVEFEESATVCSLLVLLLLGHRWPNQSETLEPATYFADPDGIIPITLLPGKVPVCDRVYQRLAAEEIAVDDFNEVMGKPLDGWLATDFFKYHVKQFKKRPIAWVIQSGTYTLRSAPAIACLVYYHKLDSDLLRKVRKLAEDLRKSRETELRGILSVTSEARSDRQESRRVELEDAVVELQRFDATLDVVSTTGFGPESLWAILRQNAIDDALLALKVRWLQRLIDLVTKSALEGWLKAADRSELHPDLGSWISDAMSHLDYHCSLVGPKPPDQKKLVGDPTSVELGALIGEEAESMLTGSLSLACQVWWRPLDEAVISPLKEQVKELKAEQKRCEQMLKSDPEPPANDARELRARIKEIKADVRELNAELAEKTGRAQAVRKLIEEWRSDEPLRWGKWLSEQPLFDQISSLDHRRPAPITIAEFIAQESLYAPDINDGVRVNIAPLQKSALLAADVLASKDLDKAIADRAEWRADERRWVREGKLPQPGWWPEAAEGGKQS